MDKNHIKENSCVPETFVSFYERWGYRPYESELSTVAFSIALHVLSQARFTARKWLSAQNHPHSAAAKCMQSTLQGKRMQCMTSSTHSMQETHTSCVITRHFARTK